MSWLPRFSPNGAHIISGSGQLFLDGKSTGVKGYTACWLTNDLVLFNTGTSTAKLTIPGLKVTEITPRAYNELDAQGGNFWAGYHASIQVELSNGTIIQGAGSPAVNQRGQAAWVHPRQADDKSVYLDGVAIAKGTAFGEVRMTNSVVVWSGAGGIHYYTISDRVHSTQPIVPFKRYRPIPVDTPEGPWVQTHTSLGIALSPIGSAKGYYLNTGGQSFYPDAIYRDGKILSAFTDAHGVMTVHEFPLSAPRVDLSTITEGAPLPVPPTPMPSIPNHLDVIKKYRDQFDGLPPGDARAFAIINAAATELAAEGAGLLSKPSGHNYQGYAVDIIIYKDGTAFDVLGDGEGAANPQWSVAGGSPLDKSRWRPPVTSIPAPPVPPAPVPEPPAVDLTPILQAIAEIKARQDSFNIRLSALEQGDSAQIAQLRADLDARFAKLRVKGSTSRDFYHAHQVDLAVESF